MKDPLLLSVLVLAVGVAALWIFKLTNKPHIMTDAEKQIRAQRRREKLSPDKIRYLEFIDQQIDEGKTLKQARAAWKKKEEERKELLKQVTGRD